MRIHQMMANPIIFTCYRVAKEAKVVPVASSVIWTTLLAGLSAKAEQRSRIRLSDNARNKQSVRLKEVRCLVENLSDAQMVKEIQDLMLNVNQSF